MEGDSFVTQAADNCLTIENKSTSSEGNEDEKSTETEPVPDLEINNRLPFEENETINKEHHTIEVTAEESDKVEETNNSKSNENDDSLCTNEVDLCNVPTKVIKLDAEDRPKKIICEAVAISTDNNKDESTNNSNNEPIKVVLKPAATTSSANSVYELKWIQFRNKKRPIVTQNENGPCPLLAIMNVLLLNGNVQLLETQTYVTPEELIGHLGTCLLECHSKISAADEAYKLNSEQNFNDAMQIIPKFQTGIDVNVRFTGVSDFEYTPECIVFDMLDIKLYHGWLFDTEDAIPLLGKVNYNQLVENIINYKTSESVEVVGKGLFGEQFLERTASQLTYHGICELHSSMSEGQLGVFFRNNHFSTIFKNSNELFILVTDQGLLREVNIVWETLSSIEGDTHFVNSQFQTFLPPSSESMIPKKIDDKNAETNISQGNASSDMASSMSQELVDYQIALSLAQDAQEGEVITGEFDAAARWQQEEGDLQLANALQEEERRNIQQRQQQQIGTTQAREVRTAPEPESRRNSSSCILL